MSKQISKKTRVNLNTDRTSGEKYILRLFVTGILPNSASAILNIKKICDEYLKGRYELEVIDIYQQPALAFAEDIVAVPVLIKKFPLPEQRLIGDLSDTATVLEGLSIHRK